MWIINYTWRRKRAPEGGGEYEARAFTRSSQYPYNQGMWYQNFLSCYFQLWFLFVQHHNTRLNFLWLAASFSGAWWWVEWRRHEADTRGNFQKKKDLKPSIQQAGCVERKWKGVEEKRYKRLGISVFHSQRGEEGFEVDDELWGESRLDGFLKSIERCKTDRWFFFQWIENNGTKSFCSKCNRATDIWGNIR